MTLHWWMHWFWITFKLILCISATYAKPVSSSLSSSSIDTLLPQNRPLRRIIKPVAQYVQSSTLPVSTAPSNPHISDSINEILPELYEMNTTNKINKCIDNIVKIVNSTEQNISQPVSYCNQSSSEKISSASNVKNNENVPLKVIISYKNSTILNDTVDTVQEAINVTNNVTVQSVEPISNISSSNETISDNENGSTEMSSVSITGITFGILMFIGIAFTACYVLYRRNFTNKLHTLNDKCSNLDSSGYIDDSSIRETSEEMYSLDNDSFLNSLEAMTIQNYWTDNLKHTKL